MMTTGRTLLALLLATACGRIGYDPSVTPIDAGPADMADRPDGPFTDVAPDLSEPDLPADRPPDSPGDLALDLPPDLTPDLARDISPDLPPDVTPTCTLPFPTPTVLTIAGLSADIYSPRLGPDGLTLYFSVQASANPNSVDLFFATRSAVGAPFTNPRPLSEANSNSEDGAAFMTNDSLELYFFSTRAGSAGGRDLYVLRRGSAQLPWQAARPIMELNTTASDYMPSLTADSLTMFFASNRIAGSEDLWTARRPSRTAPFNAPTRLAELSNQRATITSPFISADGRTLWFADERAGGMGARDLWFATRPDDNAPFGAPTNLGPGFNSAATDDDPAVSLDGRELLFVSDRVGQSSRIYRSIRCP